MAYLLNVVYLLVLVLLSPWLLYKSLRTGKYRRGMWRKLTGRAFLRQDNAPCVWFHGVSVGEIHLLRQVVAAFQRRHPAWTCIISTTTDTGFDEARKRFPDLSVFFWPFDFTWAVRRAIRRVKPSLIVLAEGELWPNFLAAARRERVPVAVVNGRMSPRSFGRYRLLGWLTRHLWRCIDLYAVQTTEYADNYHALGAPPERIHVTGSVKYDGVETDRTNPRTEHLRRVLGIESGALVWIAGSTQSPEEAIVLAILTELKDRFPNLRLILVPRQKDRFEEVAALLKKSGLPFVRRSQVTTTVPDRSAVILVDTIGELGAVWGLADIAFVGGSLDGKRGGQNMIEPAAYGAAVIFGPHIWNFQEPARQLVEGGAARQIQDPAELKAVASELLSHTHQRQHLGRAARQIVVSQQGATERTLDLLDRLLSSAARQQAA
jgi:3-deoxy-D-manno-octulosonic-acid transferase